MYLPSKSLSVSLFKKKRLFTAKKNFIYFNAN